MKKLLAIIGFSIAILISFLLLVETVFASSNWVASPASCSATDAVNFPGQNCSPTKICGDNSSIAQCYDTDSITPPVGAVTQTAAPFTTALSGGYLIDCNHTVVGGSAPYCNNGTTGFCNADNTCYATNHKVTSCTGGAWNTATCGACRSGYQDCDANAIVCEVQTGVTPQANPHTVYAASCGYQCSSGYIACAGNADGSSPTGCEIQVGGACSVGGVAGVYGPTCNGTAGDCITTPVHFITGENAVFSTTSPLLYGTQNNSSGGLIDITSPTGYPRFSVGFLGNFQNMTSDGEAMSFDNGGLYLGGDTGLKIGWQRIIGDAPKTYLQDLFYQPSTQLEYLDTYVSGTLGMRIKRAYENGRDTQAVFLLSSTTIGEALTVAPSYGLQIHTTQPYGLAVVSYGSTVNAPMLVLRDDFWDGIIQAGQHVELSWAGSYKGLPMSSLIAAYQDVPFILGTGGRGFFYMSSSTNPNASGICVGLDCFDPQYLFDIRGDMSVSGTIHGKYLSIEEVGTTSTKFYVDNSGNVTSSGTLKIYGNVSFENNSTTTNRQYVGSLVVGSLSGMLKASSGEVSIATPGSDYIATESDPIWMAASTSYVGWSSPSTTYWDTAYGWGNHALAGYLTVESDPVYAAASSTIARTNIVNTFGQVNNFSSNVNVSGTILVDGLSTFATSTINGQLTINASQGSTVTSTEITNKGMILGKSPTLPNGTFSINSSTGAMSINQNTVEGPAVLPTTGFRLQAADNVVSRIAQSTYGIAGMGTFANRQARGTAANPSAVQANDNLVRFEGWGYGTTAYSTGARSWIGMYAKSAWTDSSQPTYMSFWNTATGTVIPVEAMRIDDGQVGIGTTTFSNKFNVTGTSTFDGAIQAYQPVYFNTNPTVGPFQEGKLYYDTTYKTLSLNVGRDVNLQLNEETVVRVINNSAVNIVNGDVVYSTGASGIFPTVALADATDVNKSYILGVATQDINIGAEGFITVRGIIHDLNTDSFSAGDNIYVSTTAPGKLTNVAPTFPYINARVGRVIVKDGTVGSIYANPRQLNQLSALTDVSVTSPQVDQVLTYSSTGWINKAVPLGVGEGVIEWPQTTSSTFPVNLALARTPQIVAETTYTSPSVTAANSPQLIKTFQSPALDATAISAGVWQFDFWANNSGGSTAGIQFQVYASSTNGTQTFLFSFATTTLVSTLQGYVVEAVEPQFSIAATDVLVVKVYGTQTAVTGRTVSFTIGGSSRYSHMHTPVGVKHNGLAGLQGGTTNQYYHLTLAQWSYLTAGSFAGAGDNTTFTGFNIFSATTTMSNLVVSSTVSQVGRITFKGGGFGSDGWIGPCNDGTSVFCIGSTGENPIKIYYNGSEKLQIGASGITVTGNILPATNSTYDLGSATMRWANAYIDTMYVGAPTAQCSTRLKDGGYQIYMYNMEGSTLAAGNIVEPAQVVQYYSGTNYLNKWSMSGVTSANNVQYYEIITDMLGNFSTTTLYTSSVTSTANAIAYATTTNIYGQNFWLQFVPLNGSGVSGYANVNAMLMNTKYADAGTYQIIPLQCSVRKTTMSSQNPIGAVDSAITASSSGWVTVQGVGNCLLSSTYLHVGVGFYVQTGGTAGVLDLNGNQDGSKPTPAQDSQVGWTQSSFDGDGVNPTLGKCIFNFR